jgi:hypothetical protein
VAAVKTTSPSRPGVNVDAVAAVDDDDEEEDDDDDAQF